MGAFVSIPECKSHYNVTLNCNVTDDQGQDIMFNGTWPANVSIGGHTKGEFPGDPDIAGVGVRERLDVDFSCLPSLTKLDIQTWSGLY
jgi:hypothetical protein